MTKEALKTWLLSNAALVTGIIAFCWGPLAIAIPYLRTIALFLTALTTNDFVLDIIVMLMNQGHVNLAKGQLKAMPQAQLAKLTSPTSKMLAAFKSAAPTNPTDMVSV